ncbi:MAG: hypothetical protein HZC24_10950 [Rhodocyclales bacterium]|nr:hypothetical protein [Rhodocyclales bacterium]
MARGFALQLLTLTLFAAVAAAQPTPGDAERRQLMEQKIRLVESLLAAPAARGTDAAGETAAALPSAGSALTDARAALAAGRLDDAGLALDAALRTAIKAAGKPARQREAQSGGALQAAFPALAEQVATYRAALEDMARQGSAAALAVVGRISGLQADGSRLATAGRWHEANRKMTEAYRDAIESLSTLRAGQTVTLSLAFAAPQEEYEYDSKRFQSTSLLVTMMLDDGRAAGDRHALIDGCLRDGRALRARAADLARDGNHKEAVSMLENAVGQLNRALQLMGVAVF